MEGGRKCGDGLWLRWEGERVGDVSIVGSRKEGLERGEKRTWGMGTRWTVGTWRTVRKEGEMGRRREKKGRQRKERKDGKFGRWIRKE